MSATLQIAMLTRSEFDLCLVDADPLLDYTLLSLDRYLDLEYISVELNRVIKLNLPDWGEFWSAFDGSERLPGDYKVEGHPWYNDPDKTKKLCKALASMDRDAIATAIPLDAHQYREMYKSDIVVPPRELIMECYRNFTDFYCTAAASDMYVVVWWE